MKVSGQTLTPMFKQYLQAKQEYPDALLLFRLGDFYELFGEDAKTASRVLELTLTGREIGKGNRVPMCGVPHHAVEKYLARLLAAGYRAAICEQVEDPALAKGLVRRQVVRVVTPGTVVEDELLPATQANYLASLAPGHQGVGLAWAEVSTGEFVATEFEGGEATQEALAEMARLGPSECLLPGWLEELDPWRGRVEGTGASVALLDGARYVGEDPGDRLQQHLGVASLQGFGLGDAPLAVEAAANVVRYLEFAHPEALGHLKRLRRYSRTAYMRLDSAALRNLEIFASLPGGRPEFTLIGVLDRTCTPMGARLLREWLSRPLMEVAGIERRLEAVAELAGRAGVREQLRQTLRQLGDLERLCGRLCAGKGGPRDVVALRFALERTPAIKELLAGCEAPLPRGLGEQMEPLQDLTDSVARALVESPPVSPNEGGLVRDGYSRELDTLRTTSRDAKQWIANLEARERERTRIKSLKVGYNQVFGYYVEISKANLDLAPPEYIRKQTLSNAERFYTPELKEREAQVLGAEDKIRALEYEIFCQLREQVRQHAEQMQTTAAALAAIDVLANLAELAVENDYCRPQVNEGAEVTIGAGRHPVIEKALTGRRFVPNDTLLNDADRQLLIITGPNMAGKSTYLRQVGLIVLMAQVGSFVPAKQATIGIVDSIFTRVGAHDELATGQSTFMVEMTETASILNNATPRSLVLIDEIGRGTSTYDGLSIAWAVAEALYEDPQLRAKTLFATHYHQLNYLGDTLERAKNLRVAVKEEADGVVFLYRIVEGGTDRSYGIQVAKLAGLPAEVVERAKRVLWGLEKEKPVGDPTTPPPPPSRPVQLTLFQIEGSPVLEELRKADAENMTPLEALNLLHRLKGMLDGGRPKRR